MQWHAAREQHTQHTEQIDRVEAAYHRALDGRVAPWRGDIECKTIPVQAQIAAPHTSHAGATGHRMRQGMKAVAHDLRAARHVARVHHAERILEVEHGVLESRPAKQLRFRFPIARHGAVIIEVVAREIGEHRHVELDAGDTVLVQAYGRHFHAHRIRSAPQEPCHPRLQPDAVRCGVGEPLEAPGPAAAQRSDHAALAAGVGQRLREPLAA
jgi:hypothetical protein